MMSDHFPNVSIMEKCTWLAYTSIGKNTCCFHTPYKRNKYSTQLLPPAGLNSDQRICSMYGIFDALRTQRKF